VRLPLVRSSSRSASCATRHVLVAACLVAGCNAYDRDVYNAALDVTLDRDANTPDLGTDTPSRDSPPPVDVPVIDAPSVDAIDAPVAVDTGDAGTPPDDVPPSSSCATAHPTALFCDGFETATLTGWSGYSLGSGTAMQTTAMAYRGVGSLRADTTAAGGTAAVHWNGLAGRTTGDIYVRGFFYFPSGYTFYQVGVMLLLPRTPADNVAMMIGGGGGFGGWSGAGMQYVPGSSTVMAPRDRWVCLEMHVTLSATTTGGLEMFMDGMPVGSASGFATTPADGQQEVHVGFPHTDVMQEPATVYVDEVVVDTNRIGCD
jgi:hypothetical protein